jgi:2-amino-4-hydroxy-6-hydroxymethyldihydropteridine diphosphokinase
VTARAAPARVAVGLGSNLADPLAQVQRALDALATLPRSRLLAASSLYRNPPMGPQDQPDYVNAAALVSTALAPLEFLDQLQALEASQGRVRGAQRWGARTLDLDLLLWGREILDHPRLQVPHPGLHERAFVLYPLAEIDPDLWVPGRGALRDLLAACRDSGLVRVEPPPA